MHRAPWSRSSDSDDGRYTSFQSRTRSSIGRSRGFFRLKSMNPVTLPMGCTDEFGKGGLAILRTRTRFGGEHPFVVSRDDLDEARAFVLPVGQQPHRAPAVRIPDVTTEQFAHG